MVVVNDNTTYVVDAHCDTLIRLKTYGLDKFAESPNQICVSIPRLRQGGVRVQWFAVFVESEFAYGMPLHRSLELVDLYWRMVKNYSNDLMPVNSREDIERMMALGRIGTILSLEGGEALQGSLAILRNFYRLGVRSICLTWNRRNYLGDGVGETGQGAGLSNFGRAVIREMNALGMIIDVSHLGERSFWEAIELSQSPVIASHCNCRALADHPRNLTDEQIKAIAELEGVIGVTFVPEFLHASAPNLEHVFEHIDHICQVAGPNCVGIGSDFDGTDNYLPALRSPASFGLLEEGLKKRGYSQTDIGKILGGNFLRVLSQVLPSDQIQGVPNAG